MALVPLFQQTSELAALAHSRHSAWSEELKDEILQLRHDLIVKDKRAAELSRQLSQSSRREQQARDELAALRNEHATEERGAVRALRQSLQDAHKREQALLIKASEGEKNGERLGEQLAKLTAQLKQQDAELFGARGQVRQLRIKMSTLELASQQHHFVDHFIQPAVATKSQPQGGQESRGAGFNGSSPAGRAPPAEAVRDVVLIWTPEQLKPSAFSDEHGSMLDEIYSIEQQQKEFLAKFGSILN